MENKEMYGAIRVKHSTITEYRRLKLATEGSLGHEISHDEFMQILLRKAMMDTQGKYPQHQESEDR